MTFRIRHLLWIVYIAIGVFVAWNRGYLGTGFLRALASALIAVLLWWLALLGVNLHVH